MGLKIKCPWCGEEVSYDDYLAHVEAEHPEMIPAGERGKTAKPALRSSQEDFDLGYRAIFGNASISKANWDTLPIDARKKWLREHGINEDLAPTSFDYLPELVQIELVHPEQVKKAAEQLKRGAQWSIPKESLKKLYVTILGRFADEEAKGINEYEGLLARISQSLQALGADQDEVKIILIELQRRINRILQEERTHRDAIVALKEMFETK